MTKDEFERLGHRTRMVLRVAARHYGDYGAIEALTGSSRRSVQSMMYGLRQRFGMSDAELLEAARRFAAE